MKILSIKLENFRFNICKINKKENEEYTISSEKRVFKSSKK